MERSRLPLGLALGRRARAVAALLVVLAWTGGLASGGDADEARKRTQFAQAQRGVRIEAAKAHIELGIWCRDAGLPPQATAEFLRAEEVSEGQLPFASKLVGIMRTYGDKFWKNVQKKPRALLDTYERKARKVELDHQKQRLRLARDAVKAGLDEEGYQEYCGVVRATDLPLVFDAAGLVVLDAGKLPANVSARMRTEAIEIDGRPYLRDEFLRLVPEVRRVFEADGERLRVRSTASAEQARDVFAVATAMLPQLEDEMDGRPTRKLQLFLFAERASYATWCRAAGREGFAAASGLADGATFTAVVSTEGSSDDTVRGMSLHELAHLYHYGVSPAVMPSWYAEGFAEAFGGPGTFAWDGTRLTTSLGPLDPSRLATLRGERARVPLGDLLRGNALSILIASREQGGAFYVQSWAFLRWLRTAAPADVTTRYRRWEAVCRGAALGAKAGAPRQEDVAPASEAFLKEFSGDLPALEAAFVRWLETP